MNLGLSIGLVLMDVCPIPPSEPGSRGFKLAVAFLAAIGEETGKQPCFVVDIHSPKLLSRQKDGGSPLSVDQHSDMRPHLDFKEIVFRRVSSSLDKPAPLLCN